MLKTIIIHLKRILLGILSVPARLLGFGGGISTPPSEAFEEVVDGQVDELRQELDIGPQQPPPSLAIRTLGEKIHAYAAGDAAVRNGYDLSCLPDHVAVALCTLTSDQLNRLGKAGPQMCGRWGLGEKKTGLVGVPLCKPHQSLRPRVTQTPGQDAGHLSVTGDRESDPSVDHSRRLGDALLARIRYLRAHTA
ncbi:hypothetical protein FKO01_04180 [Mesorhizobium sp. B2-3-3]|nr:hypothetical protein FKO01_04180 [Mesorhizobium sp. B2-3-3]